MSDKKYLGSKQVAERYGDVSWTGLWRKIKHWPDFPKPYYFGERRYWALDELEAFEASRPRTSPRPGRRGVVASEAEAA